MSILNWTAYFIEMARLASKRSKDPNAQIGAVVVGPKHEIRATGYNGFPRGIDDMNQAERWRSGVKQNYVVHAETNAIVGAARVGVPLEGCTLYTVCLPCIECTKLILQAGIVRVVVDQVFMDQYTNSSWLTPQVERHIRAMFHEAAVSLDFVYVPNS